MAGKKSEKRKYSHSRQLLDKRLGLLLMVPIAAVIFGITGIPFIRALYLSFTNKVVYRRRLVRSCAVSTRVWL